MIIFALYLTLLITDLLLQVVNNCKWPHEASKEQISSNHKLHHIGLCAKVCENSFESTRARRINKHYISLLFIAGFSQQHPNLVDHCFKPVFVKHFCSWMNPINVTLNVHSKSPAFQAKHLKDPDQQLPGDVDTKQLAWKRTPIRSYFGSSGKAAPCLQIGDKVFWNSIDNHNRSCERYIGLMSRCLSKGRVKDFREAEEKPQVDTGIRGFICHGSKDENE